MDFEQEEKKVKDLLKDFKLKSPPHDLRQNYMNEVRKKIELLPSGWWPWGFPILILLMLLGAVAIGFLVGLPKSKVALIKKPSEFMSRMVNRGAEARDRKVFEKLSEDLFLLQILGEDEGLAEEFDSLESDMEFFSTV